MAKHGVSSLFVLGVRMTFIDPNVDPCDHESSEEPYERPGGRGVRYTQVQNVPDGSFVDDQATDDLTRHARGVRRDRNDD